MLTQEQLIAYLEATILPVERARLEDQASEDAVALQQLLDQQRIHEALRAMLANDGINERVKQSILAVVRGQTEAQLRARVLVQTRTPSPEGAPKFKRPSIQAFAHWVTRGWRTAQDLTRALLQTFRTSSRRRLLHFVTIATVFALSLGLYVYFQPAPGPHVEIGQFAFVMGTPIVQHASRSSRIHPLRASPVYLGDRIETGDTDRAEIQFKDGTSLRLNFNTILEIPRLERQTPPKTQRTKFDDSNRTLVSVIQPAGEAVTNAATLQRPTEVKLLAGHVWLKVQKSIGPSPFAVQTPVATAAVKGTEFGLRIRNAARSQSATRQVAVLTVNEGAVEFSNAFGKVEATALTESLASVDSAPTKPARIASLKSYKLNTIRLEVTNPKLVLPDETERMVFPVGWIGINLANVSRVEPVPTGQTNPGTNAVLITRVWPGSPGERAGLKVGEQVSAVNGQSVTNPWQVSAATVSSLNRPITLSLQLNGEQRVVALTPVTPFNAPALPGVPVTVQKPLFDATWQLISAGLQNRITSGQTADGEIALHQLLQQHTDCAAIHHILAFLHEAKDELSEAIRYHRRAVELDPQVALYHLNLGLALRGIGNLDRALEELEEAVRLAPDWWLTVRSLGEVYSLLGRVEDAVNTIDAGLRLKPLSSDLFVQKAEILLRDGQSTAALPVALRAVELDPAGPLALILLGNVYIDLGRIDEAEATYRQTIALGRPGNVAHVNLARLLYKHRGQLDAAEALYRKALEREPDDVKALDGLGTVLGLRRQFAEAESLHRRVVELEPSSPRFNTTLGNILHEQGRLDEAERMYRKALELDSNYVDAYGSLANLYGTRRQFVEAERMYRALLLRSAELLPADKLVTYGNLAAICGELGKLDEAESLFREALTSSPDNLDICNNFAAFLADHHLKLDEALALSRRAVQAAPKDPYFLGTLGSVQFELGELAAAEATIKRAIELAGDNPPASDLREQLKKLTEKKKAQIK